MTVTVVDVPPAVNADGFQTVWWADAIANVSAPSITEITSAVASLDLSCYLDKEWELYSSEQEESTDERFCSKETFSTPGVSKYTVGDLLYVVDPQNPQSLTSRASQILVGNKRGFLVIRRGKDQQIPAAVGDVVDVIPVQLGMPSPERAEKNGNLKDRTKVYVIGNVARNVKLVA